jgi:hypothetical protein
MRGLAPVLRDDCRPNRVQRGFDRPDPKHGIDPALVALIDGRGPRVSACGRRMVGKIEDVDDAFPNRLALEDFTDGNGLGERGVAPVLGFDSVLQIFFGEGHPLSLS